MRVEARSQHRRIILGFIRMFSESASIGVGRPALKLLLVLEIAFAGIYLAFTRNLLVIYLASVGFGVAEISLVMMISAITSSAASAILYRSPKFMTGHVKLKLAIFHALERILWIPLALSKDVSSIIMFLSVISISSTIIGSFINLVIYGSFDEDGVRCVTAKRTAANNAMSILGSMAAVVLLAALPAEEKFPLIFMLGSMIGLLSTLMVVLMDVRHLEDVEVPEALESPEHMFSISSFLLAFLTSGNLLGVIWAPYLMSALGAPDYVAASMNLAATVSSMIGSLFWARRSLRTFRAALGMSTLAPLAALFIPSPSAHIGISAFNGFARTGGGFLGNLLFARYLRRFGVVRSSLMITLLSNLSQLMAMPLGILLGQQYPPLFWAAAALAAASTGLALLTIPEVAVIPEDSARTYSYLLYTSSLTGYSMIVEMTRETIIISLRLLALAAAAILVYVVYRLALLLAGL